MSKVNYDNDNDNDIHAPTYTRNEVMQLLELVGVVKHKQ